MHRDLALHPLQRPDRLVDDVARLVIGVDGQAGFVIAEDHRRALRGDVLLHPAGFVDGVVDGVGDRDGDVAVPAVVGGELRCVGGIAPGVVAGEHVLHDRRAVPGARIADDVAGRVGRGDGARHGLAVVDRVGHGDRDVALPCIAGGQRLVACRIGAGDHRGRVLGAAVAGQEARGVGRRDGARHLHGVVHGVGHGHDHAAFPAVVGRKLRGVDRVARLVVAADDGLHDRRRVLGAAVRDHIGGRVGRGDGARHLLRVVHGVGHRDRDVAFPAVMLGELLAVDGVAGLVLAGDDRDHDRRGVLGARVAGDVLRGIRRRDGTCHLHAVVHRVGHGDRDVAFPAVVGAELATVDGVAGFILAGDDRDHHRVAVLRLAVAENEARGVGRGDGDVFPHRVLDRIRHGDDDVAFPPVVGRERAAVDRRAVGVGAGHRIGHDRCRILGARVSGDVLGRIGRRDGDRAPDRVLHGVGHGDDEVALPLVVRGEFLAVDGVAGKVAADDHRQHDGRGVLGPGVAGDVVGRVLWGDGVGDCTGRHDGELTGGVRVRRGFAGAGPEQFVFVGAGGECGETHAVLAAALRGHGQAVPGAGTGGPQVEGLADAGGGTFPQQERIAGATKRGCGGDRGQRLGGDVDRSGHLDRRRGFARRLVEHAVLEVAAAQAIGGNQIRGTEVDRSALHPGRGADLARFEPHFANGVVRGRHDDAAAGAAAAERVGQQVPVAGNGLLPHAHAGDRAEAAVFGGAGLGPVDGGAGGGTDQHGRVAACAAGRDDGRTDRLFVFVEAARVADAIAGLVVDLDLDIAVAEEADVAPCQRDRVAAGPAEEDLVFVVYHAGRRGGAERERALGAVLGDAGQAGDAALRREGPDRAADRVVLGFAALGAGQQVGLLRAGDAGNPAGFRRADRGRELAAEVVEHHAVDAVAAVAAPDVASAVVLEGLLPAGAGASPDHFAEGVVVHRLLERARVFLQRGLATAARRPVVLLDPGTCGQLRHAYPADRLDTGRRQTDVGPGEGDASGRLRGGEVLRAAGCARHQCSDPALHRRLRGVTERDPDRAARRIDKARPEQPDLIGADPPGERVVFVLSWGCRGEAVDHAAQRDRVGRGLDQRDRVAQLVVAESAIQRLRAVVVVGDALPLLGEAAGKVVGEVLLGAGGVAGAQQLAGSVVGADAATVVGRGGCDGLGGACRTPCVADLLDDVGERIALELGEWQQRGAVERAVARNGDDRGDPAERVVEAAGCAAERIDGTCEVADGVVAVGGGEVAGLLRAAGREVKAGVHPRLADLAVELVVVVQRLAVAGAGGGRGEGGNGPAGGGFLVLGTAAQVAEDVVGLGRQVAQRVDAGDLAPGVVDVARGAGPLGGQRVAQLLLAHDVAEDVEFGACGAAGSEGARAGGGGAFVVVGLGLDGGDALPQQVVRVRQRAVAGTSQRGQRAVDLRRAGRAGAAAGQRGAGGKARHRRRFAEGVARIAGHVAFGIDAVAFAAQPVVGLVAGIAQHVDVGDRLAEGVVPDLDHGRGRRLFLAGGDTGCAVGNEIVGVGVVGAYRRQPGGDLPAHGVVGVTGDALLGPALGLGARLHVAHLVVGDAREDARGDCGGSGQQDGLAIGIDAAGGGQRDFRRDFEHEAAGLVVGVLPELASLVGEPRLVADLVVVGDACGAAVAGAGPQPAGAVEGDGLGLIGGVDGGGGHARQAGDGGGGSQIDGDRRCVLAGAGAVADRVVLVLDKRELLRGVELAALEPQPIGGVVGKHLLARRDAVGVRGGGDRGQQRGDLRLGGVARDRECAGVLQRAQHVAVGVVHLLRDQPARCTRDRIGVELIHEAVGAVIGVAGRAVERGVGGEGDAGEDADAGCRRGADARGVRGALDQVAGTVVPELGDTAERVALQHFAAVAVVDEGGGAVGRGVTRDAGGVDRVRGVAAGQHRGGNGGGRLQRGVARHLADVAGGVVGGFGQRADRVEREAQPVFVVVGVAGDVAARVGLAGHIAVAVVRVRGADVQAAGVDLAAKQSAGRVVGVLGRARGSGTGAFGDRDRLAALVVGKLGAQVEPGGVDRHAGLLSLGIEGRGGDGAVGVGDRDRLALAVVGVARDERQPGRIDGAGQHAIGSVVRVGGGGAARIDGAGQAAGVVVVLPGDEVEAAGGGGGCLEGAILVVVVDRIAAGADDLHPRHLAVRVVGGDGLDAFGRGDRELAAEGLVGIRGGLAALVDTREHVA